MRYLSKYEIAFKGLKEGKHRFDFELDGKFFEQFENSEVEKGNVKAVVTLNKQSTLLILNMEIDGEVELLCDRCLENYMQSVTNESKMYVKFAAEAEDEGDEIIVVPFDQHQLNLAQYLYELTILGLPIKHAHPYNENGESTCNPEMENKLNEYLVEEIIDSEDENEEDEPIDERWNELKKLLDNK